MRARADSLGSVAAPRGIWLHALLFAATCATTFLAGGLFSQSGSSFSIASGVMFSAAIMGILLCHEMGHFVAARLHGVDASLPYFLPFPLPPIGTFGAIIKMRQPPRTRSALIDIGSAGPLCGMLVTLVVTFIGLKLSVVRPLSALPEHAWMEGNSLLYLALKKLAHPEMGPAQDVWMHPLAWAGWVGILVTSLNLIPVGQLDGGHVLYALVGPRAHRRVGLAAHGLIFGLGMIGLACYLALLGGPCVSWLTRAGLVHWVLRASGMLPLLFWTILLRFVGHAHPPVEDPGLPLGRLRLAVGLLSLAVLVATFTPVIGSPLEP